MIREEALRALDGKRSNTDGAALFWTIPPRRHRTLLRLLVNYEIMADFLDSMIERGAHAGMENGRQLHLAMVEAVDTHRPISDYYEHHPWKGDGGYLRSLVEECRCECSQLASYEYVRPHLIRAATLAQVQGINHEPEILLREAVLQAWTQEQVPTTLGLGWYELAGAASAWLTVLALMAVAAEPAHRGLGDARSVSAAYFPWIALAATLLDSYGDLIEDQENQTDSYISRYGSLDVAARRIDQLVKRATREARALPRGDRHAVIVASMIALYLSKDSVRTAEMALISRRLQRSGGSLTMFLGPILRAWRVLYSLQDA